LGSHNRYEEGVCAKKGKGVSVVEGREKISAQVHQ